MRDLVRHLGEIHLWAAANVVDAAGDLLRREGPGAVTVRRLAAQVDASTTVIYSLFGSKDGIVAAMFRDGFTNLDNHLTAAVRRARTGQPGGGGTGLDRCTDRVVRRRVARQPRRPHRRPSTGLTGLTGLPRSTDGQQVSRSAGQQASGPAAVSGCRRLDASVCAATCASASAASGPVTGGGAARVEDAVVRRLAAMAVGSPATRAATRAAVWPVVGTSLSSPWSGEGMRPASTTDHGRAAQMVLPGSVDASTLCGCREFDSIFTQDLRCFDRRAGGAPW